jgi:hypothetical protein
LQAAANGTPLQKLALIQFVEGVDAGVLASVMLLHDY